MADELSGKTLLLVDDDRDILAAMIAALEDKGPHILTASDGNEALRQAAEGNPDLVVLDMMLPKRSGFLVIEKLKRGKKRGDPPRIIMITGNQGSRHKVYAKSIGVDDYLNKPFRMEKLLDSIEKLLS